MRATLDALGGEFDLLVIGGGIHGAFATLEAARRGVRVLLLERSDYGAGTSANSLKIAHGGLRYLARGNLVRLRESIAERGALMALAPHLVRPLPCAMPVDGVGRAPAIAIALRLNEMLSRRYSPHLPSVPAGRLLDAESMDALAERGWWGGARAAALWYDALIHSPERLLMMVLREAVVLGAVTRNYTAADALLRDGGGRVCGVSCRDSITGAHTEIRARLTLNVAGRSAAHLVRQIRRAPCMWADGWNVVLHRRAPKVAIALPHSRERRLLFAVPWRGRVLLGTGYAPAEEREEGAEAEMPALPTSGMHRDRAARLVREAAQARPELALNEEEIALVHGGSLPMSRDLGPRGVALLDRPLLLDHEAEDGVPGLVTSIGVKWTTARAVARAAVDLCFRRLGMGATGAAPAAPAPLCGVGTGATSASNHLLELYGPLAGELESIAAKNAALAAPLAPGSSHTGAQVAHAFRAEGAVRLSDALMRRSGIATAGWPGKALVRAASEIAAKECGWSAARTEEEVRAMERLFAAESEE